MLSSLLELLAIGLAAVGNSPTAEQIIIQALNPLYAALRSVGL